MEKQSDMPPSYTENPPAQPGYGYGPPGQAPQYPNAAYPPPQGYAAVPPPPGHGYGYSNVVVTQQPLYQPVNTGPPPPDRMCMAIFVTICCFWPTGILAILRASDARHAVARGDMISANRHADTAKTMITISIIVGIIAIVLSCIFVGIYVGIIVNALNESRDQWD